MGLFRRRLRFDRLDLRDPLPSVIDHLDSDWALLGSRRLLKPSRLGQVDASTRAAKTVFLSLKRYVESVCLALADRR